MSDSSTSAPPKEYRTAWEELEATSAPAACVQLGNTVALVTGANDPNAIGYHTALYLARGGAKVYVGARTKQKARQAISSIKALFEDKDLLLEPFVADLSDLSQVKTAADKLRASESRLNIIINNAAIADDPSNKTEYGLSTTMVVNYLAPCLLVKSLRPLLEETAKAGGDVRIVNMTSTVHTVIQSFDLDCKFSLNVDPSWSGPRSPIMQQYALSKLALVMFTKVLQRDFDNLDLPILVMSVFPGFTKTTRTLKLMGNSPDMIFSPSDCAFTGLFAATEPSVRTSGKYGGAYIVPFGVIGKSTETAEDEELGRKLWQLTGRIIDDVLWML